MISPQEQFRVLSDVARRHLASRLVELPDGTAIYPVYAMSGGLDSSRLVIFGRGEFPADSKLDFGLPALNGWKLITWPGGACVTIRFAFGIESIDFRKLLEAGVSALDATPIQSGNSAQGETR